VSKYAFSTNVVMRCCRLVDAYVFIRCAISCHSSPDKSANKHENGLNVVSANTAVTNYCGWWE